MEKHFLSDFVHGEQTFRADPWYNPQGDCIVYQTADEAIIRDRIDETLTIYRSAIDERPIGFQIKDVIAIIKKFGLYGLVVQSQARGDTIKSVCLSALLLAAYEDGPKNIRRRLGYADALTPAPGWCVPMPTLCES